MPRFSQDIDALLKKIETTPRQKRHIYQHRLDHLILCMRVDGTPVPRELVEANENLRRDIMEDQFDNMPV